MSIESLEADLVGVRLAESPDSWALAAYRLAVARSEAAGRPEELDRALELLDKAARILTAARAPLEHGRILTAAANCHRAGGRSGRALELFMQAAELLAPRASPSEHVGALINLGLARCEAGQPAAAIDALDRAVALGERLLDGAMETSRAAAHTAQPQAGNAHDEAHRPHPTTTHTEQPQASNAHDEAHRPAVVTRPPAGAHIGNAGDEARRLLGAALINRAQARQALGGDEHLEAAACDYRAAIAALPDASMQAGMAAHGLGAAMLELCRRGSTSWNANDAVGAFEQSLGVLSHASFPFHHAVARHSLALAYEIRGESGDLVRALNSAGAAISVFDPRLHTAHWQTTHNTLTRLEAALDDGASALGTLGGGGYTVTRSKAGLDDESDAMGERDGTGQDTLTHSETALAGEMDALRSRAAGETTLTHSETAFDDATHAPGDRGTGRRVLTHPEAASGGRARRASRLGTALARLLAATTEAERDQLLRDRLLRASSLPPTAMGADLDALIGALAELDPQGYRRVLRSLFGVLMELPDRLLEAACRTICRVHASHDEAEALDETLDAVITERLFGPQRVRVRDLLEANGWVRP